MKKPTIIKSFPSQQVEEYRIEHGHLPTTEEPCEWVVQLLSSTGVTAETKVHAHDKTNAVKLAIDEYFAQFPNSKIRLKSVSHLSPSPEKEDIIRNQEGR